MKAFVIFFALISLALTVESSEQKSVTVSVKITGAVKNSGTYELRKEALLREAIVSAAGGFTFWAHEEHAFISRRLPNGEIQRYPVDLKARGMEPVGVLLKDSDELFVPERI